MSRERDVDSREEDARSASVPVRAPLTACDALHALLTQFLREYADHGMGNAEAAEFILSSIERCLPDAEKIELSQLRDPKEIFRVWATEQD